MEWQERTRRELQAAEAARARGNEGRARVCARRAAGVAVEAYLKHQGVELGSPNVLDQFRHLLKTQGLEPELRPILEHLLRPKIKDDLEQDSYWPRDIDLVAEVHQLIGLLFPTIDLNEKRAG